ncbi:Sialidase [Actinoplanes sp. SE50]|uniref:discoidin domain-containing protein n=1 Tax=unclassified Actinoplanes TaxID=2626549 RepID=UPI00023ECA67|nr:MULTISPECIES: discoidin domain-containing protein [unclassified Actinoplanes]AEV81507.1 Sialidase [Actinoplanes sp. SE50/110]ATO79910.1 Sialidase [Actinoplanes sp. SE50]SLL97312.1 sialidase [Actinoplanes sp. SE50/110]
MRRSRWRSGAIVGLTAAVVAGYAAITMTGASAAETLLSQGRPATASSTEAAGAYLASEAVDGNTGTRWSSAFSDPQWLQVDLGSTQAITRVELNWETAAAKAFQIQVSDNAAAWTPIYSTTTSTGGNQSLTVNGSGRYVRMYGTQRTTGYGYSLWEFKVYGGGVVTPTPSTTPSGPALPGGGSLGAQVTVFDPTMSSATIQARADAIFKQQETNQFGTQRNLLAFKPGTYNGLNIQVGFNTSVIGLGQNPDDVRINGDITVDAGWFNGNATQNFWRSVENMSLYPVSGADRWAVSQAAPFRRMDVHGDLNLAPNGYGWASGGYIADTRISGVEGQYSQQQWFTRNSRIGSNSNAVWNQTFVGVQGAPAQSFPNPPYTTIGTAPVIREKPYLYLDGSDYAVFVPSLSTNSSGVSWANGNTPGTSIPLNQFYVAKPGDSAATINQALAQGLNLIFQPGVYHVNQTITVNRANTVVLGLGYATIIPDNGVTPLQVADVDGVKVAGLLFDAGTTNSANLLVIGPNGSSANHAANPTTVQDVFFRIGGSIAGKATNSLLVNSNNTIIDHIWAWRADHGNAGTYGWTVNTADSGLIVNGQNVTAYGLFVEHYQKYEVVWNGNGGRTYFLQNEQPYDPPSQAAWRSGANGYAAYKVADSVTSHEAWGLGSYCNFTADSTIHSNNGFEVPVNSGVRMHDLLTVSLGGAGVIDHVINNTGAAAQGTATVPVYLASFN